MNDVPREKLTEAEKLLRDFALSFPEVAEEFPWGHRAFKVKKKIFVTMGTEEGVTSLSVKLPKSKNAVLKYPYASPTHYGLGKHGWVTVVFDSGDELPMVQLRKWIDESYRAVAPKTVLKLLSAQPESKKPKKKQTP